MVSSCIVPRCKRRRRTGLSYYRFPVKDAERCKLWLRAVHNPKYDEDTAVDCLRNHRVCSLHFKPEDFERHLVWEAMGGDGVKKLRPTAVPSLNLDDGETSTCAEQVKVPSTTAQASAPVVSGPSVTSVLPWATVSTSIPSRAPSTSSCPPPQATLGESLCSSTVNHLNEPIHQETELSSATESTSDESTDGVLSQSKTIVNDSCLMDLFKKCQTCGQSINTKKVSQCGAQKKVRWSCLGGHRGIWMSSPYLWEAFPEIHLLTTLSILFSGGTFVQFKKWAQHLHLNFMANKTFFEIQKAYLNPEKKQKNTAELEIHQQRVGSYIQITDDGHCVSSGFILTRTKKGRLKKIKSNLRRREKASLSLQSSFEEMEVTIEKEDDNDCNSVKNRMSTTSELLLECDEEDLEPWQKQASQVDLKNEDNVEESTNEETVTDCKSEPSTPPRNATNTSPPALKTETPQAVVLNKRQVTGSFSVKSLQPQ